MEGRLVKLEKMKGKRELAEDLHLNPGDMVFVPRTTFSKFRRFIPTPGVGMYSPLP
jgi:hypothetical protein